ncbi:MAG: hypothetical protein JHD16_08335 [Solirubrobacteraceae bacterium]|nr:hypothetical protein [Solirubrobacteraceae bacterium]
MKNSIASAWVALRRPAVFWTALLATAGFALLGTTVTFLSATETAAQGLGPGPGGVTLAQLAEASGITQGLVNATTLIGVIAIGISASAFGGDFSSGTVRTLLVRQPKRLVFLGGKLLAVFGLLAAATLLATVVGVAASFVLAGVQGVDTSAWSAADVITGYLRLAAATLGFAVFGAGLGLLLRSPVAAIAIGVGWALAFELILTAAWDTASDLLPASLLGSIADGTATLAQSGVIAVWLAAILAASAWSFLRRDVRI